MEKRKKLKKVLIIGSGALKIGEAGEFDYSGSQAAKALKEEGIQTILVNPNIATIQTSRKMADRIYLLPVNSFFLEKIIKREKPDGIMLGFGGQTALNCGLDLYNKNILHKYNLKVLGSPIQAIIKTEDRQLFRKHIVSLGLKVPESFTITNVSQLRSVEKMNFPVIVRAGYSLGGLGSGIAENRQQLIELANNALNQTGQILVEEYLKNWKELEYEVVRDNNDNTLVVCNMENFDPMGIHTGESIVVAPSQTLNNYEYHKLREIAIKVVKSLPIIGECNIQFALNPKDGDYRIIEVNARLSRSSALASKATGYPLAYVAAKLSMGYYLDELKNNITKATSSFFEPALDYIVVKIPRWDFLKFKDKDEILGSEMQSVGEVMAIGRSFEEAFQKASRSLALDYEGIISDDLNIKNILKIKEKREFKSLDPTPSRPYNIAFNIFFGQKIREIYEKTGIDTWFLERIEGLVNNYKQLLEDSAKKKINLELLKISKKNGFSDRQISEIYNIKEEEIRKIRKRNKIMPKICQIDTLAGEFPAKTNYLYLSYHKANHDLEPSVGKKIGVLGGGPYQIGSSVEFDWCAVNCVEAAKDLNFQTIMVNCNPETVSTDYDISDRLYFEELTKERVLDIAEFENCPLVLSVGGQIPNNLAPKLKSANIKFIGSSPEVIDKVENREKFSALLDKLGIIQPEWKRLNNKKEALDFARSIGYPVLIRPSYVLSGRAMFVAYSPDNLKHYLDNPNSMVSSEYPLVISKFIRGSKEIDYDGVSYNGEILVKAISEHIEHSGVHSGDATLVLPGFSLSKDAKKEIEKTAEKIVKNLKINSPFNIQFLVNDYSRSQTDVLVIEANLRASRSFPFVSKVTDHNFIKTAVYSMLGQHQDKVKLRNIHYAGVKVSHFSFTRLRKVDPVLRVEMASTGEVACLGRNVYEAYLKALLSTGMEYPKKAALLSLGGMEGKQKLLGAARVLQNLGFKLYATQGTCDFLRRMKLKVNFVYKVYDKKTPSFIDLINQRKVDLVINIIDSSDLSEKGIIRGETDGYLIRRASVEANIPLFTKATIANLFIKALSKYKLSDLNVKSWNEYIH